MIISIALQVRKNQATTEQTFSELMPDTNFPLDIDTSYDRT